MSKDEIKVIAEIVGGDRTYAHFVNRINKEFEAADEERNSKVYVLFVEDREGEKVGFSVIGHSPAKMRVWQKTFRLEGWVGSGFTMSPATYELMYMYVKPQYRKGGFGVKLFRKTFSFAREKRIEEVYAYVGDKTSGALDFYKSMNGEVLCDFSDSETSSAFLKWSVR
ncbi:hypothetical protein A3A76_00210 [Candidatus Woesebacteria bacterium RIFCSPLOWO2_01_FULL_39_23]|uniref:N-acetyltransferase domain-containing protein n=1 Tax=Candidatus Woesebacteria bacterium RIFCSPHIGHO2_01_FULL_40_22 TaxID=1802499 RepID=A0A1F7YIG1_9BACT|nr:MAG: hypothetical protein A2141_02930 [Candidatus Woesebacteria bacterium RBG_16_40_11]OGM26305.1 MAG: hypothetical protein A2628_03830 [Candidatus Woesebacteria bacterium RIFCSPHIGHO2_01_FULL_40_22]OGM35988.1 MAG: hypothetical protein A3E41_00985 [Candidatus Woesebacteria bacterium RIFCSPHIGHO2_12_FULL_38_9]OGM62860.1 MAG: hypothetical protein A3A76_00210 [Candidatus Woesebacteria bacterium RIFCSPLOWO2_01_FULL_39_23]